MQHARTQEHAAERTDVPGLVTAGLALVGFALLLLQVGVDGWQTDVSFALGFLVLTAGWHRNRAA
jgi:hypothetical protein